MKVKKIYGAVLEYDKFVKIIREAATVNNTRLAGIIAYGDYEIGTLYPQG